VKKIINPIVQSPPIDVLYGEIDPLAEWLEDVRAKINEIVYEVNSTPDFEPKAEPADPDEIERLIIERDELKRVVAKQQDEIADLREHRGSTKRPSIVKQVTWEPKTNLLLLDDDLFPYLPADVDYVNSSVIIRIPVKKFEAV